MLLGLSQPILIPHSFYIGNALLYRLNPASEKVSLFYARSNFMRLFHSFAKRNMHQDGC